MDTEGALLEAHSKKFADFAERMLRPYIERRRADPTPVRSKEFNDPIWGTLKFRAAEIVVLDSPLLQRLRRIRQLGVAHLVYPAAVHTRLEHSLGVAHQTQQIAESIESHSADGNARPGSGLLKNWHIPLLRLTGLCHDVGHGLMSHVSENALDQNRECADIRLAFQGKMRSSRLNQLSEIAAYYIFDSPAFSDLLRLADQFGPRDLIAWSDSQGTDQKIEDYREAMKKLVVGQQIDDDYPLIHELISGPFDADKLDYMPRDANMCGVPVVTDVTRLIRKVRLVSVGASELPREIAATVEQRQVYGITGIARSGARTLDELALGRALMFDKIYRHQKVRAAESMVASLINELLQVNPDDAAMLPYRLVDEDLYTLSRANAQTVLGLAEPVSAHSAKDIHLGVALDIAARLRDRRLLVRGFAFSSKMPMDPYRSDADQRAGIDKLNRLARNPSERSEFVRALVELATDIAQRTGEPVPSSLVTGGRAEPYVWISAPIVADGTGEANQIGHAWLLGEYGEPIRRADQDYAETRGWSDAYVATRDLGLIFCPQEMAPCIYLAAEVLVRERFNVRTPESMRAFAKQDPSRLRKIQEKLVEVGWYANRPRDLAPEPAALLRADANQRIDAVVERLGTYSGPLMVDPETGKSRHRDLTRARIKHWLRQFEHDLVDSALTMLTRIEYIGRSEVRQTVDDFLRENEDFHGASLVPLGQPKDSSSVLTYFAGDVASRYGCTIRSLGDALLRSGPIVMVDDYVGRGSAAITIFEDWFGADQTQDLNQERAEALSTEAIERLKAKRIALVFVAGREDGAEAVKTRLRELGVEHTLVSVAKTSLPNLLDESVIANADQRARLISFCRERGKEALIAAGRDEGIAEARALGYGNNGLLLISSYNTPTAAVTCLWHEGPEWTALFPRRSKR